MYVIYSIYRVYLLTVYDIPSEHPPIFAQEGAEAEAEAALFSIIRYLFYKNKTNSMYLR